MKKKKVSYVIIYTAILMLLSIMTEQVYNINDFFKTEIVNAAVLEGNTSSVTTSNSFDGIDKLNNDMITIARYEVRRSSGSLAQYKDDLVISFNPQTKDTYMLRVSRSTNEILQRQKMTHDDQQIGFGTDALPKLNQNGYEINGPMAVREPTLKIIERFGQRINSTKYEPNYKWEYLPKEINLAVSYLDESGNEIAPKDNYKVYQTQNYEINNKNILNYKLINDPVNRTGIVNGNNNIAVVYKYKSVHFGETPPLLEVNKKNVSIGDTLNYKLSVKTGVTYPAGETPKNFNNFKVTIPVDNNLENIRNIQLKLSNGAVVGTGTVDTTSKSVVATLSKDVKDTENLFLTYDASVKQNAVIGTVIKQTAKVQANFDVNGIKTYSVQSNTVESTVERQLTVKINYLDTEGKKIVDSVSKIGFLGNTYDYNSEMKKINKYKFPPKVDDKNNPISGTFEANKDVTINLIYDLDLATINIKFKNDSGMDTSKFNYSFSTQFKENIDLSTIGEINKRVAEIENLGYNVEFPENYKDFPVNEHEITTIYKVAGKLELKEWPNEIDFGTQRVSNTTKSYWPTMKKNLVVRDTRGTKNSPWQLTVAEIVPLSLGEKKLDGVLSYQSNKDTEPETLSKSAVIVETHTNASDGEFNTSHDWGQENEKGIKATIPVEQQKVGTYNGTLSWSLVSAPGN